MDYQVRCSPAPNLQSININAFNNRIFLFLKISLASCSRAQAYQSVI